MVAVNSYLIQDLSRAMVPAGPQDELELRYEYYFLLERGRAGLAAGDPRYADLQRRLASLPPIAVPSVTLDGVLPASDGSASKFTGHRIHRVVPGAGHNVPQEAPATFAAAVMELMHT
jgi:pimeloyl-ACP methyl ester carboxylesterase